MKNNSELITITKVDQVPAALGSAEIKEQVAVIAKQCNGVVICDESSLSIGTAIITSANKLTKAIEAKRKALKAPYIEMGKAIDRVAEELSEAVEASVAAGKVKILGYHKILEEEKRKAQEALDKKMREDEEKVRLEQARIDNIVNWLLSWESNTTKEIFDAVASEHLATIYKAKVLTFPADDFFAEFIDDAKAALGRVKEVGKKRKEYLESVELANSEEAARKLREKELKRQEIISRNVAINAENLTDKQADRSEEIAMNAEIAQAANVSTSLDIANQKVSGIRKTWDFEIVDANKVPKHFFVIDEAAIKKWMMENKEVLTDGEVVNGIKFYQKEGVALR